VVGAQVLLDGEPVGLTPLPALVVSAGPHRLAAKREGFLDGHLQLDARGGSELTANLDPISVAPPTAAAPERPHRRRWVWPLVGVGAALVVGAALAASLTVTLSKNYSTNGRDSCHGDCVLFDR
jgi:hypothetical protein